ncbi:PDC2 [Cordylochernes scorpioides]|uniref:PDC2 n=1 Tax=Cordylochernes scorpioides TaxID=51811 RepID=A0ABY6LQH4_9ARAC|nr:PDC2 [Cordylochernes scorpioides]
MGEAGTDFMFPGNHAMIIMQPLMEYLACASSAGHRTYSPGVCNHWIVASSKVSRPNIASFQLQKMVELADAHLPTELRLDYAVHYFEMAWYSVSPDSISNCWNHTGIRFTSTAAVEPLNYGNLLDRIRNIFAITPENLMTEREFQLVDDCQEAEMKLTDDNLLVSTVTAKEELGEDDDATVTQRLPSLREARTAAETVLLFLEHFKRATYLLLSYLHSMILRYQASAPNMEYKRCSSCIPGATSDDVNLSADLLRRVYVISEEEKRQVVIIDFFKKM